MFVASVILLLLFIKIPFEDVTAALRETRPGYAWAASMTTFVLHVAATFRLQKLCVLQHIDLSAGEVFKINTGSQFYGQFLPAGNFAAIAIRFYRRSDIRKQYREGLVAMFGDRVLATISLCLIGGVFWVLERPKEAFSYLQPAILFYGVCLDNLHATCGLS